MIDISFEEATIKKVKKIPEVKDSGKKLPQKEVQKSFDKILILCNQRRKELLQACKDNLNDLTKLKFKVSIEKRGEIKREIRTLSVVLTTLERTSRDMQVKTENEVDSDLLVDNAVKKLEILKHA